jgi:glycosyltransferase involved in cell wall biosynthesis
MAATMAQTLNTMQIMNYLAPYPGNFMRSILALDDALKQNNSTSVLLFPGSAKGLYWIKQLQEQGRNLFFLSGRALPDSRLIASLIKRFGIRILHTHFAASHIYLATRLARLACPAAVSIVHMHNHEKTKGALKKWLKRSLIDARLYVGVSKDVSDDMVAKGYSPKVCVYIPNAVDFSRLDRCDASRDQPSVQSGKKILMFGFDFKRKGVDIAVEALHKYDSQREMTLMIVLASNHDAVRAGIERMLGEVPAWIKLLPPRDDVAAYYRMADVFISPSREEGLPYALLEAAYCGVRTVASDISGQRSIGIPHMLHFKSGDSHGLYQALKLAMACDAKQNEALVNEARSYVTSHYRLGNWVDDVVRAYRSVSA